MDESVLHIRSFRVVFDLERRIHRIDRFRVPLPYGLPLKSIGYAVVALVAVLIARRFPVIGQLLDGLPAPARYVLLPIGISYALTRVRVDGRSAHRAAAAWLRFRMGPRTLVAFRPAEPEGRIRFEDVGFVARFPCRVKQLGTGEQTVT